MTSSKLRLSFVLPFLVMILTWPLIGAYYDFFSRMWIWLLIGCMLMGIIIPRYYGQFSMLWAALYVVVLLSNYAMDDAYFSSLPKLCTEIAIIILAPAFAYYCSQSGSERISSAILIVLIFIIAYSAIATFILDMSMSGIVRYSAGIVSSTERSYEDISLIKAYYRMGLCNYALPHALPVIIPSIILGIKNKSLHLVFRVLMTLFLTVVLLLVYISDTATTILLSITALLLSFFTSIHSSKRNFILIGIVLVVTIFLLMNDSVLIGIIDFINGKIVEQGSFSARLEDIKESIMYDETYGDLNARVELYQQSTQELTSSLLLGSNGEMGGHSAILDRLSTLGLLGFLPLCIYFVLNVKAAYKRIIPQHRFFYVEGVLMGVLMLSTKNMNNWEMWLMLFVLMPLMIEKLGGAKKRAL